MRETLCVRSHLENKRAKTNGWPFRAHLWAELKWDPTLCSSATQRFLLAEAKTPRLQRASLISRSHRNLIKWDHIPELLFLGQVVPYL